MLPIRKWRNSKLLRWPLTTAVKACLSPLTSRLGVLRRAAYDVEAMPYLVVGGREMYVVSTRDKVIGRELFLNNEFDFEKFTVALNILKSEGFDAPTHLIDVGTNIGTIAIPAIKRGLIKTATAIEPHPENLRLLRANLALNGVDEHVTVLAQAVGDQSNITLHLHESTTNSGSHSISNNGISVHSSRLDDLSLPRTSLLWMDIEGYEGHALRGATELLASGIPVVCEFNPQFLKDSGSMTWFKDALKDRRIYDLKHGARAKETTIDALELEYDRHPLWTDILAIAEHTQKPK